MHFWRRCGSKQPLFKPYSSSVVLEEATLATITRLYPQFWRTATSIRLSALGLVREKCNLHSSNAKTSALRTKSSVILSASTNPFAVLQSRLDGAFKEEAGALGEADCSVSDDSKVEWKVKLNSWGGGFPVSGALPQHLLSTSASR